MQYKKVIFICKDNSSLSPMAEAIFKDITGGDDDEVLSFGLVVLFGGPVNPKTEVVLESHGLAVSCPKTRKIDEKELTRETLVVAMNTAQRDMFHEMYPLIPVASLGEYIGEKDIEDPFGGSLMDYEKCFQTLSVMLRKLKDRMEEEGWLSV